MFRAHLPTAKGVPIGNKSLSDWLCTMCKSYESKGQFVAVSSAILITVTVAFRTDSGLSLFELCPISRRHVYVSQQSLFHLAAPVKNSCSVRGVRDIHLAFGQRVQKCINTLEWIYPWFVEQPWFSKRGRVLISMRFRTILRSF